MMSVSSAVSFQLDYRPILNIQNYYSLGLFSKQNMNCEWKQFLFSISLIQCPKLYHKLIRIMPYPLPSSSCAYYDYGKYFPDSLFTSSLCMVVKCTVCVRKHSHGIRTSAGE